MFETNHLLQTNAKEISECLEVLRFPEINLSMCSPEVSKVYGSAATQGRVYYANIRQQLSSLTLPPETPLAIDIRSKLEYLSVLKRFFNKFSSANNEDIRQKLIHEHHKIMNKVGDPALERFVFVQQLLGYVWETYPSANRGAVHQILRELQILFRTMVSEDPSIYTMFHITVIGICPYVLGIFESNAERRRELREQMRLFITNEEVKSNDSYYDVLSATMYFFLIMHAALDRRYEYILARLILNGVPDLVQLNKLEKVHIFHQKAMLRGLLMALGEFADGTIESSAFKTPKLMGLQTWTQVSNFVKCTDEQYNIKELLDLKMYCRTIPNYVHNPAASGTFPSEPKFNI